MNNEINSVDCLPELNNKPKGVKNWVKAANFKVRNDFTQKISKY